MRSLLGILLIPLLLLSFAGSLPSAAQGTPPPLRGDADGNREITSTDARMTLMLAVELLEEKDVTDPAALDVDGDREITSTDARLILQKAAGKIGSFPAFGPEQGELPTGGDFE